MGKSEKRARRSGRDESRIPIDDLLQYWIDLSKQPTLTPDDFRSFLQLTEKTLEYFSEHFAWARWRDIESQRDIFFKRVYHLSSWKTDPKLEKELKKRRLKNHFYNLMKTVARGYVVRIKKVFAQDLVLSRNEKTPAQDAENIISISKKLTYRWAAGIVISNHIASLLIRLLKFEKGKKFNDDIGALYENLKNRTDDQNLKRFLFKNYQRFKDADKTRNRCAHVDEGEPTVQEIEQSISLSRLLQPFVRTAFRSAANDMRK